MKVLHINTFDQGGASNSCIRLHLGLIELGVDSKLLVKEKKNTISNSYGFFSLSWKNRWIEFFKKIGFRLGFTSHPLLGKSEKERKKIYKQVFPHFEFFSTPFSDFDLTELKMFKEADIIHLHWVAGFLDYPSFFSKCKKPVVWTLHDMAPFTGGYHYVGYDLSFEESRKEVPHFSEKQSQLLNEYLTVKKSSLSKFDRLSIVAPSQWLLNISSKSELFSRFSHSHIPYGLSNQTFCYQDALEAKTKLNLPSDKKILLFVSDSISNPRKGMKILLEALKDIEMDAIQLCCVGKVQESYEQDGLKVFGNIQDPNQLATIYAAADLFVIPSLEDNLPNTVLEALMCGTPVLGFPIGGIPEMVIPGENGFLASEVSVEGLSKALQFSIENLNQLDRKEISNKAKSKYSSEIQAKKYLQLYQSLLN
jgi:glycosyltransferase involved in cell wall biosynthesis